MVGTAGSHRKRKKQDSLTKPSQFLNLMATPVKVYGPPLSTAVSRVLACLLEKDVEFQLIPINMAKGEHKKADFIKIQVRTTSNDFFFLILKCSIFASQIWNVTALWPSTSFSR